MTFLGMISNKKEFEIIRSEFIKNVKDIDLILMNEKNMRNLQNVKFEALVIHDELNIKNDNIELLQKICKSLKYLIINADKNIHLDIFAGSRLRVITYGLNHKSTVTASSIEEDNIMVALQREVFDRYGNLMEIGEKRINKPNGIDIYSSMVIFIMELLYRKDTTT